MGKIIFKYIESLIPVLAFYPLWFICLLIVTFCLFVIVLLIGIVLYPNASKYIRYSFGLVSGRNWGSACEASRTAATASW